MQVYQTFQDQFEAKLEEFLAANGCTQELLLSAVQAAENRRGSSGNGCDIAAVILASLEYDVFLEMIRIVKKR